MMKYLKYYIVPFLSSSVLLGIFLGGHGNSLKRLT